MSSQSLRKFNTCQGSSARSGNSGSTIAAAAASSSASCSSCSVRTRCTKWCTRDLADSSKATATPSPAASVVSLPGTPLIPLIYASQVVNAVMLPLHVVALQLLARDPAIMGDARSTPTSQFAAWVSIALVTACVGALAWSWIGARG